MAGILFLPVFLLALGISGYIAEKLLKNNKRFKAWTDSLPMSWLSRDHD